MVQATEESVWAYVWPRLHGTWAKTKSSVLETHYIHKKGAFREQVKDLTPPAESKDAQLAYSALTAWLHMVSR